MAQLMESYEQQFSHLTAEIVSKTGRIPNLSGGSSIRMHKKSPCLNNVI